MTDWLLDDPRDVELTNGTCGLPECERDGCTGACESLDIGTGDETDPDQIEDWSIPRAGKGDQRS